MPQAAALKFIQFKGCKRTAGLTVFPNLLQFTGLNCEQCKVEFFNLNSSNEKGCTACGCHPVGTDHSACNRPNGQCACRNGIITDRRCVSVLYIWEI